MDALTRISLIVSIAAFAMIFLAGGMIQFAIVHHWLKLTPFIDAFRKSLILTFFFLFALGLVPGFISLFVHLQGNIGNDAFPLVRLLRDHHTAVTLTAWAFLSTGILIALPFMSKDLLSTSPDNPTSPAESPPPSTPAPK
ncbi:MAG TPA: hypothetical protein VFE58_17450 [Tepidisphaeraceae bacterium]|jgi:hypothetical protein|nr:hypothetical protein [Tepidisphaeraceae bacterium]